MKKASKSCFLEPPRCDKEKSPALRPKITRLLLQKSHKQREKNKNHTEHFII
jgi:hypothetical protein